MNLVKFGETLTGNADGNPEPSLNFKEGVETKRQARKRRDSPDHKLERGSENYSGKHNGLVLGSNPSRPTTHQ